MTETPTPLDDTAFIDAVLDMVIPPSGDGRMPGAGSLGLSGAVVRSIAIDAQFGPAITAGLLALREAASGQAGLQGLSLAERHELVETTGQEHPALLRGLARYVFLAYYQHPRVLGALGQPARPPYPEGFTVEATDPELLAILDARKVAKPGS